MLPVVLSSSFEHNCCRKTASLPDRSLSQHLCTQVLLKWCIIDSSAAIYIKIFARSELFQANFVNGKPLTQSSFRPQATITILIESQQTNFSKSPDRPPNPQIVFVQIFLRIGGDQLGLRLHSPNGSKWPDYQIGEIQRIVG